MIIRRVLVNVLLVASVATTMMPAEADELIPSAVKATADLSYDLAAVRAGAPVPYLVASEVPEDLRQLTYSAERKDAFFKTVLPLILSVNDDILVTRKYLLKLNRTVASGSALSEAQKDWLSRLASYYHVEPESDGVLDLGKLIPRVDIIPPSLAMAQGAEESGYGTSRFADEANALFGQLTRDAALGIKTNAPELKGTGYLVRAFADLRGSISAYARNLNTHRAYADFRAKRADMRLARETLDPYVLASQLIRYCGCGDSYPDRLKNLITKNALTDFDSAALAP
jgi:Bax protein